MTSAPTMWRELHRNMAAPDVLAVQRGLWRYLGLDSTNARNANYGEFTARDVALARKRLSIPGGSQTVGQTLFEALWPYIDATGRRAFCRQPAACPTPSPRPKRMPLKKGMEGADVQAAQRALWQSLGNRSTNERNGVYGQGTVDDVRRFRSTYAVNQDDPGVKIGGDLWDVLTRFMDDYSDKLVADYKPPPPPEPSNVMEATLRTALSQVGYQEAAGNRQKFGEWYGMNRASWCAIFDTWAAEQHSSKTFVRGSRYSFCPTVVEDARAGRNGLKVVSAGAVMRGALVLFDWGNDGISDHIGFVDDPPGGDSVFATCEGNTSGGWGGRQSNGDGVYRRTRYLSDVVLFASYD